MSKGTKNERKAAKALEQAGWWVYNPPQRAHYGDVDQDPWNLFDVLAFHVKRGELRMVQVKTNGTQSSLGDWAHLAKHFEALDAVTCEFWIRYDREGWRVLQVDEDGDVDLVGDTREWDDNIDDGLANYLRAEVDDGDE